MRKMSQPQLTRFLETSDPEIIGRAIMESSK